jgi:protein-tyrosine phosphatase
MVDIHCHILPGLDDGPASLEISLEMADMAINDGITHVVATPHANHAYEFLPDLVRQRQDEIRAHVADRLNLVTGCDFHLSFENLQDLHRTPAKYAINQKNYLLVEFAEFGIPPTADQTLHELQLAGLLPIITHPERNALLCARPQLLEKWVERGCYVQVTAGSLLGHFGPQAKAAAGGLLDAGRVHFFATDAHNTTSRPPRLREAYELVAQRRGQELARALFLENPLAAFEGRPLPYIPEPPERANPARRRKRFLFF